jgi:hypothetical protein
VWRIGDFCGKSVIRHTHVLNPEGWRLLITVLVPIVVTVVVAIAAVSKAVCRKQNVT